MEGKLASHDGRIRPLWRGTTENAPDRSPEEEWRHRRGEIIGALVTVADKPIAGLRVSDGGPDDQTGHRSLRVQNQNLTTFPYFPQMAEDAFRVPKG